MTLDLLLAAALRGENPAWCDEQSAEAAARRINYHGIAGLLAGQANDYSSWPEKLMAAVRAQATSQAMWELRHRAELINILDALARKEVDAVLLKGTALAYDLYRDPSSRSRGDSDLLVAPEQLERTRSILIEQGYRRASTGNPRLALQEGWHKVSADGARHELDLHWALMNSHALEDIIPVADCLASRIKLPALGDTAYGLGRVMCLIHACMHQAMHISSPYLVDGQTFYGADRLIWIHDLHLLGGALEEDEWRQLVAEARRRSVAAVCRARLDQSARLLGSDIPVWVRPELDAAPRAEKASAYLLQSRQLSRARQDLVAASSRGLAFDYLRDRLFPSATFMRAKYPLMPRAPLAMLYARRGIDLLRRRRAEGQGG